MSAFYAVSDGCSPVKVCEEKGALTPSRGSADTARESTPEPSMPFLLKEEPSSYSYDSFAKDGQVTWTGVKNPLAQKHLRSMKKGDLAFYYHTGDEKSVVGIAKATRDA